MPLLRSRTVRILILGLTLACAVAVACRHRRERAADRVARAPARRPSPAAGPDPSGRRAIGRDHATRPSPGPPSPPASVPTAPNIADPVLDANGNPTWADDTQAVHHRADPDRLQPDPRGRRRGRNAEGRPNRRDVHVRVRDRQRRVHAVAWPSRPGPIRIRTSDAGKMPEGFDKADPAVLAALIACESLLVGDDGVAVAGALRRRARLAVGRRCGRRRRGGGGGRSRDRPSGRRRPRAPAPRRRRPATRLVAVTRTTLVASQPVAGTVTSSETWTVGLPTGATPDEVAAAEDAVAAATDQLAAARSDCRGALGPGRWSRPGTTPLSPPPRPARRGARRSAPGALDRIEQDRRGRGGPCGRRGGPACRRRGRRASWPRGARPRPRLAGRSPPCPPSGTTVARGETLYALDGRPTALLIGDDPGVPRPPRGRHRTGCRAAPGESGGPRRRRDARRSGRTEPSITPRRSRSSAGRPPATSRRAGSSVLGDTIVLPDRSPGGHRARRGRRGGRARRADPRARIGRSRSSRWRSTRGLRR